MSEPFSLSPSSQQLIETTPYKVSLQKCYREQIYVNQPITEFTRKIPKKIVLDTDPRTESLKKKPDLLSQNKLFTTRTDAIRREHDRRKKRSFKQLTLNLNNYYEETEKITNYNFTLIIILLSYQTLYSGNFVN